jgi:hypothetical protein
MRSCFLLSILLASACGGRPVIGERVCPEGETRCGDGCIDVETDPEHCGGCDLRCDVPNATAECRDGDCAVAMCDAGYGDCDGEVVNGCESELSEPDRCGGCDIVCGPEEPVCAPSGESHDCATGCPPDARTLCDGTCLDALTDPQHCGGCDLRCDVPNATAECRDGDCAVAMCDAGYGDCDGEVVNGCESELSEPDRCGGCDIVCGPEEPVCAPSGESHDCATGCPPDARTLCDGTCLDALTDPQHCGDCDTVCDSGVCRGGVCQPPSCSDEVRNGDESDTDCGGTDCPACGDGRTCRDGEDCISRVCTGGVCQPPRCDDEVQNGNEGGVDCGGTDCDECSCLLPDACTPDTTAPCNTECGTTGTHTCDAECTFGECVPPGEVCNGVDDDCDDAVDEDFALCTDCCESEVDTNTCVEDEVVCETEATTTCEDDPTTTIVDGVNPTCPACSAGFGDRLWDPGTLVLSCGVEGPSSDHCAVAGGWGPLPPFVPGDFYCCISGCNDCVIEATATMQIVVDGGGWGWTSAECL